MTTQQLDSIGFVAIARDKKIKELSYKTYLEDYDNSEIRMWIEECEEQSYLKDNVTIDEYAFNNLSEEEQDNYIDIGMQPNGKFEIWAQKINRKSERCNNLGEFDSEEEAKFKIYEQTEWYINEKNWDAPIFFDTKDEAIADLASYLERKKEVVERYIKICEFIEKRDEIQRIAFYEKEEERKATLAVAVLIEASLINIDQIFIDGIKHANTLNRKSKSDYCVSIMKALLQRIDHTVITSDFWQVFRILKSKAEQIIF